MHSHPVVVLIDENPATLVELTRALMTLDVSLSWFTTTADALATVHRSAPAIVICGPDVPGMEAAHFLEHVAQRSPRTQRLLLVTALPRTPVSQATVLMRWPANLLKLRNIVAGAALFPALPVEEP